MSGQQTPASGNAVAVYLDPPTHHQFQNRLFDRQSNLYAGDDILAPYVEIRDRLAQRGIEVRTADLLPATADGKRNILISFGTPDRLAADSVRKYAMFARRPDVVLSAFFAMECPIVEPTLFASLPVLRTLFRRILSWSDAPALLPFTGTPVEVEHFCWPQSFDAVHDRIWSNRERGFLVMMNANKLPRLYVDELYTARLRAVEFFHRHGEIDLYGRNWDRVPSRVGKTRTPATFRRIGESFSGLRQKILPDPLYVAARGAWRGPAASKSETISKYRFALCFENSVLKGWMTEKLFDCFFAGTVPVYWGAPDVLDWVPAACFIDMREFKDFAALRSFLHALTPVQVEGYREAARAYLASDRFDPFRSQTFADRIVGIVDADSGTKR
ncbi:MAG: glycosyltransferase family 10 [Caldimonas sp.]